MRNEEGLMPGRGLPGNMSGPIQAFGNEGGQSKSLAVVEFKPRDIQKGHAALMEEARFLKERAFYTWAVQSKDGPTIIEGPSVHLMMAAARHFRNLRMTVRLQEETKSYWYFLGVVQDIESGIEVVRPHITPKPYGNNARQIYAAFQAGVSRAIRNALGNILPSYWLGDAMEEAKKAAAEAEGGSRKATTAKINQIIAAFNRFHIEKEALIAFLGKPANKWTGEDIAALRAQYTALRDSEITPDDFLVLAGMDEKGPEAGFRPDEGAGLAEKSPRARKMGKRARGDKITRKLYSLAADKGMSASDLQIALQEAGIDPATIKEDEVEEVFAYITQAEDATEVDAEVVE